MDARLAAIETRVKALGWEFISSEKDYTGYFVIIINPTGMTGLLEELECNLFGNIDREADAQVAERLLACYEEANDAR